MKAVPVFAALCILAVAVAATSKPVSPIEDKILWSVDFSDQITDYYEDIDNYFVVTNDFQVMQIDKSNGKVMWMTTVNTTVGNEDVSWTPKISFGGQFIVVLAGHNMYGLEYVGGSIFWQYTVPSMFDDGDLALLNLAHMGMVGLARGSSADPVDNPGAPPTLLIFNEGTVVVNWTAASDMKLHPKAQFAVSAFQVSKNSVLISTKIVTEYFNLHYYLEVLQPLGGENIFGFTGAHACSPVDYQSEYVGCVLHKGHWKFQNHHQVVVYDTKNFIEQWSYNFSTASTTDMSAAYSFSMMSSQDKLIAAYYPYGEQQWAAAFNLKYGGAPFINMSLPNATARMSSTFYPDNGYLIFPVAQHISRQYDPAAVSFFAVDLVKGKTLWSFQAPSAPSMPLTVLGDDTFIVPNYMGWSKWKQASPDVAPQIVYENLHEFGGVLKILANDTEFTAITGYSVTRYQSTN